MGGEKITEAGDSIGGGGALKFMAHDGAVDNDMWRQWKRNHRVSSAMYNILLHLPGNQYFAKRLTNEGKLKHMSKFQE